MLPCLGLAVLGWPYAYAVQNNRGLVSWDEARPQIPKTDPTMIQNIVQERDEWMRKVSVEVGTLK